MTHQTDVLIIGAGPTGSTTALALANCGVRCHVVSRGNWMADSPRAHITNQRANEVFATSALREDVSRAYASPWGADGRYDLHHQSRWPQTHPHGADVGNRR